MDLGVRSTKESKLIYPAFFVVWETLTAEALGTFEEVS